MGNIMKIKRSTYICSKHYVGEKGPTFEFPDPIPALLHTDEQVKRFHRKRKAPATRSNPVKIQKLSTTALHDANEIKSYWDGNDDKESSKKGTRKRTPKEELFLTLIRLRRGYSLDTMSHFFGVATSTISTIFSTWIQLLYCHFNDLRDDMFPERQHCAHDLPRVLRTFKNIRCTIDCTEFFVQMPRDFRRQGNLYLSYKNHHTVKSLIGVAPNGSIVYVSDLSEGPISDKINPGDLILADRGFTIEDLLIVRQASLNIPPFLGKRTQFTVPEELKTRRIAKARIYVERGIERVKKFKLLSGNIPLSLSPLMDQLVFVACCLVNFQEPLVK